MKQTVLKSSIVMIVCMTLFITVEGQVTNLQLQNIYTLGAGTATPRFALGDLNNDGRQDLVTTSGLVNMPVNILLNNGSGGFANPVSFGATLNASVVAIGDYNRDGFADLAIGSISNTEGINIRFGNGTGAFPSQTSTAPIETVTDVVTADFNGDGNLDLAITKNGGYASQPTNAVRLMLGNGAGGFGVPTSFEIGAAPVDLQVTDINSDGRPDIVALSFTVTNTLRILLNTGTGGFALAPGISWPNASSSGKVVAADINRDCATDLAVVRSDSIAILLGDNAGNFTLTSIATNPPASIALADFNLDRRVDLAIGRLNTVGNTGFTIMPGNGAGGFGMPYSINSPEITDHLAVLDVGLDGRADIALSRRSNSFVLFQGSSNLIVRTLNDYDADGKADLSVFRPAVGDWFVHRSTQGPYQANWGIASDKLVPADYDGDFRTDIAVWRETGFGDPDRSFFFILRSSDGTFQQAQFGRTGDTPTVVGDWDGDGRSDLAVYRPGASGGQSTFFYRPSGNGAVDFNAVLWGLDGDEAVRGDFDGDGRIDAAVFRPSDLVWYILGSSNGQITYTNWGLSSDRRVPADYDGDGRTDVAVFRPADGTWYILASASGTPIYRQWGIATDKLVPSDYNGDGKAEVAVYRSSNQQWYVPQCAVFDTVNTKFGTVGDLPAQVIGQ